MMVLSTMVVLNVNSPVTSYQHRYVNTNTSKQTTTTLNVIFLDDCGCPVYQPVKVSMQDVVNATQEGQAAVKRALIAAAKDQDAMSKQAINKGSEMEHIEEQIMDASLFINAFHSWLETHGVTIGEFVGNKFVATIDLNKLKPAIMNLKLEAVTIYDQA